jgi:hypothetical protein
MQHSTSSASLAIADSGRIRVGAGVRIRPPVAAPTSVIDSGRIRTGAGVRIRSGKSV